VTPRDVATGGSPQAADLPRGVDALLDRLAPLYGLVDELASLRVVGRTMPIEPLEASVSLGVQAATRDLRVTVGLPSRSDDPESCAALCAVLEGLGAGSAAPPAVAALALAARGARERRFAYGAALRTRPGRAVQPRPATWIGGDTVAERSARVAEALASVGLDDAATISRRLVRTFGSNPFSAVVPYGLGLGLGCDGVTGAKVYFACESAEVVLDHLRGPIAEELDLGHHAALFEVLVEATGPEWRRARWLLEASFELPADPAAGARAKLYVPPSGLAASDPGAHKAILRVATELGLDAAPYEALIRALRPGGLSTNQPPTLMMGVSVMSTGPSLEAYVFVHSSARAEARLEQKVGAEQTS
jgi:hypothetical protein